MFAYDLLQKSSWSLLLGAWLTIFYKRDFEFQKHVRPRIACIIFLILFWSFMYFKNIQMLSVILSIGTLIYVLNELQQFAMEEKLKAIALAFSLMGGYLFSSKYLVCAAVFCALTQLLRWPISLKKSLRELRIIFGPMYTVMVVFSCIQDDLNSRLLLFAMVFALFASIVLRPDNNEVLKVLNRFALTIPSQQCRKMTHGFCMFFSFILCMLYIYIFQTDRIETCILCLVFVIAIINVTMYIFVADFPRKIILTKLIAFWDFCSAVIRH